jgi:stringent starvation protein B
MEKRMLSNKPYLIRAFYDWIVDSECTPFLVVNATYPNCKVPTEFIEDGQITLNVAPVAIRDFKVGKHLVEFRASFSGVVHIISVPVKAVLSVYAQENGQGMFFDFEDELADDGDANEILEEVTMEHASISSAKAETKSRASHLKLVE